MKEHAAEHASIIAVHAEGQAADNFHQPIQRPTTQAAEYYCGAFLVPLASAFGNYVFSNQKESKKGCAFSTAMVE